MPKIISWKDEYTYWLLTVNKQINNKNTLSYGSEISAAQPLFHGSD